MRKRWILGVKVIFAVALGGLLIAPDHEVPFSGSGLSATTVQCEAGAGWETVLAQIEDLGGGETLYQNVDSLHLQCPGGWVMCTPGECCCGCCEIPPLPECCDNTCTTHCVPEEECCACDSG